jgi:hypothetical protein
LHQPSERGRASLFPQPRGQNGAVFTLFTYNLTTLRAVLLLACLLAGCAKSPDGKRAFYFWRTDFALSPAEQSQLTTNRVSRLYLRLFDVSWNQLTAQAEPIGLTTFTTPPPPGLEVVPVVFLRNELFTHDPDPAALADRLHTLVRARAQTGGFSFHELQVDCDWTDSTREAFFAFCRRLRTNLRADGATLSATIRLHQIKYSQRTGVPPVERGMLMFYNLGRLAADTERPSIFNTEDAARYTASIDAYPLPLDAALPVFSWAVQSRAGRVVALLSKPKLDELAANASLENAGARRYVAQAPSFVSGGYLQIGDTLSLEVMTPAASKEAAELLARHFHPRGPFTISLFDLDERNLHDWTSKDLDTLFSAVR